MRDLFYLRSVEGVSPVTPESFSFFERAEVKRDAQGVAHIAYRMEDLPQVRALFRTRRELRKRVYLHPRIEETEIKFCELVEKASRCGFQFNGRTVEEATERITEFELLNDSIMNHLEIWMVNCRTQFPSLYEEFAMFKSDINQFTDYLVISESLEALQTKSPLFFSPDTGDVQRIAIPY